MIKRLQKIGNSTGVIINKALLDQMGVRAGDLVRVGIHKGALIVAAAPGPGRKSSR